MFSFWGFYGAKVMKNFHHLVNVSPNECEDLSLPADDELRIGEGIKKDDFWAGCKSRHGRLQPCDQKQIDILEADTTGQHEVKPVPFAVDKFSCKLQ